MNSTNPFYQTLCFFKVIEGIRALRRDEARKKLVGFQGVFEERVPGSLGDLQWGDEFTSGCLKPYLGQRFTKVIDKLRDQARNAVAHLDPDNQTHVQADLFESRDRCEAAAIVLHFVAHRMLHNEIPAQEAMTGS